MNWPSAKVRDTFIQYFLRHPRHPHTFIPSSSIVPKNDPSLAFVNAGMNQFKDTILGIKRPGHLRVVNSQKCLRINDLSLVGADSYHHTFFEMLGNWSFSSYFKKEACEMAWELLVKVYGLDPQRLYITYFSGGESIPPDRETKEIWEDIGVSSSRILPFGKDNFWSMARMGPCGPSTEIHYDHRGTRNDSTKVNQDFGSVVEIWNLVFMQYNRTDRGTLERLPLSHVVDTGAGLERLTAVMNGKLSNYDTDLFLPIFQAIQEASRCPAYSGSFQSPLDRSYRVIADHLRAITVALSDGMLPQTNVKIRRLIHRSVDLIETYFLPKAEAEGEIVDLLTDMVEAVSSTLSRTYPEIHKMKEDTIEILETELHRYICAKKNRLSSHDSLPHLLTVDFPALARIKTSDIDSVKSKGIVDTHTAFKWVDSHGVAEEAIEELCKTLSLKFDAAALQIEMNRIKKVFRDEVAKEMLMNSENIFIRKIESLLSFYDPRVSGGVLEQNFIIKSDHPLQIEWIFDEEGDPVEELSSEASSYWVVLNTTPFFPGNESVVSDVGELELENKCSVRISDVKQLPSGWILHLIREVPEIGVCRKAKVVRYVLDQERKIGRGLSFSIIYQLKQWLKDNFGVVRFNKEFVSWDHVRLEMTLLNGELYPTYLKKCEEFIRKQHLPVAVTNKATKQNGVFELYLTTGNRAKASLAYGQEVADIIADLRELLSEAEDNYTSTRDRLREELNHLYDYVHQDEPALPYEISVKAEKIVNEAERLIDKNEILYETSRIANALRKLCTSDCIFLTEGFESDIEFPSLIKITRVVGRRPTLILIYSPDGYVQGRCTVPEDLANEDLRADKWMNCVVNILGHGTYQAPKGQDPKTVVNLKRMRIPYSADRVRKGLEGAREYVSKVKVMEITYKEIPTPTKQTTKDFPV